HKIYNSRQQIKEWTDGQTAILGAILSVTFFVLCMGIFAFSPERRNSLRRFCQRTTTAVRYIRVNNEEANLLLEPNGDFTESDDDDMIL
uniref:Uncharacterized protein n=1 Tax=Glossina palpalis gambiensis TaxID=67801 RepID=A0A1B0BUN6_9MUSC